VAPDLSFEVEVLDADAEALEDARSGAVEEHDDELNGAREPGGDLVLGVGGGEALGQEESNGAAHLPEQPGRFRAVGCCRGLGDDDHGVIRV
jgi:hypothetical protein